MTKITDINLWVRPAKMVCSLNFVLCWTFLVITLSTTKTEHILETFIIQQLDV